MKTILIAAALATLATGGAQAATQSAMQGAAAHNPAVKESHVGHVATPAEGANSFTQAQAQGRIAKAGYANVSALAKDKDGVWRGTATKAGRTVSVGLDFKGNVTTR
ncbi:hypothetical protein [Sphingomonas solaris]|uniref:PepSY domain-containing protein n=1 Tax=Alterirhizorhabdus solaris TaxID=2529389 RepID=A0A558QVH1_9SPHN|nr:hypothetical protein [Sphingomonas solaris]TVV71146.1 hypothetical protein FOY91_17445 [Sphingomonas solaris]